MMSGSQPPDTPRPAPDPSMDDILASIRRILNEDESPKTASSDGKTENDVFMLDDSMMVPDPHAEPAPASKPPQLPTPPPAVASAPAPAPDDGLLAPAMAEAAASSVGQLMRTLASARGTATHRDGPTIEDLVREEVRPILKQWLDTYLPPIVERLVRAEIERVVGRMAG